MLVDAGAGDLGAHAAQVFPGLDHSTSVTGLLPKNMRAAGLEPSEIDTAIITYAHPDHVGGTRDEPGGLVFPNANYFISANEWDFWNSDEATTKAPPFMVDATRRIWSLSEAYSPTDVEKYISRAHPIRRSEDEPRTGRCP